MRNHDEDDDGISVFPLHERSDPGDQGDQGGIVKTTEFQVTNTTNLRAEVRPEHASEGGGLFVSLTTEGGNMSTNSVFGRV